MSTEANRPPDAPRRQLRPEARRAQILEAALRCFGERGYAATTMDDLVRASGLSKGSLYWHFESKLEVFLALIDAYALEMFQQMEATERAGGDALEVLRVECRRCLEVLCADRSLIGAWSEFMVHAEARQRMNAIYDTIRRRLGESIEAARRAGEMAPGPDASLIAGGLAGMIDGLLLQWLLDPDFDCAAHFDAMWEAMTRGVRT